jgi:transposase
MNKKIVTLGIDLSKSVFQCHGVNDKGMQVFKKTLTRSRLLQFVSNLSKCVIVTEACGGANYFARKFKEFGHEARLIAPVYVKPFVKSNKDDDADAEAIVEADSRPNMRYVPIKQPWQQDLQSIHRVRQRLIRNKTALTNEMRGLLMEYGITIPKGDSALIKRLPQIIAGEDDTLSGILLSLTQDLFSELIQIKQNISGYEKKLAQIAKKEKAYECLNSIRGIGLISITALVIALADPKVYKNGRHFSAWLGLVPKHTGTGGKNRNLGISKRGDNYTRGLLIHGARAAVRAALIKVEKGEKSLDVLEKWIVKLCEKKGVNKTAVALANKNARIAWALMASGQQYDVKLASGYQDRIAA